MEPINKLSYNSISLTEDEYVEYRIVGIFQDVLNFAKSPLEHNEATTIFRSSVDVGNLNYLNNNPVNINLFHNYQNMFTHLTRAQKEKQKAPHKVILLLAIISLIDKNKLENNRITLSEDLIREFSLIWKKYIKEPSPFKMNIVMPYKYLQNEPFWHLQCNDNEFFDKISSISSLIILRKKTFARFDNELFSLLCNENLRKVFKETLIRLFI